MSSPDCDTLLAGRYRLEGRIAAGGMGEVWRAVDTVLERPVAVKLLRAEYSGDPDTLARFRAEARHAAAVSHPGIAHVYDYGEGGPDGSPFLVMELVNGPALTGLLGRGPLDAAQTMDVVAQAAAALAAAHATGLVHRDIKPGNLLVGPGGIVKITDFGIAYAAGSAPLTRTGALIGTPAYLAPERVAGAPATPSSDLYALGIVAYECLAGTPPFTGMPMQVALAHQRQPVPPLPASVPGPVARFVADLTAREPARRPRSAADTASRARHLRAALTDAARVDGWPEPPSQPLAAAASGLHVRPDSAATSEAAQPADPEQVTTDDAQVTMPDAAAAGPRPATADQRTRQPPLPGSPAAPPGTITLQPSFRIWSPAETRRRRPLLRPSVLLAAAAVVIAAAVAGWLLAGRTGSTATPPAAGSSAARHSSATVNVNQNALIGLTVKAAEQQLRKMGLSVRVTWVRTRRADPGTVLAVQPNGQVQTGTPVVLTAASSPIGHHHHGTGSSAGNGSGGSSAGNGSSGSSAGNGSSGGKGSGQGAA